LTDRSVPPTERIISAAGDPFLAAGMPLADMTASERDAMVRILSAKEYRQELRCLAALGVDGPEAEDD
jgi:hypothetical protein